MIYRKEIDGLRAFAVVPVVLFHAGFDLFSGGFVGVDIFVISGYLISMIVCEQIDAKEFSIMKFYERRARRLLPALYLVLLACSFYLLFQPPFAARDLSQSIFATVLFSQNILQYPETIDYFALTSEYKPLLHTWTLGSRNNIILFSLISPNFLTSFLQLFQFFYFF